MRIIVITLLCLLSFSCSDLSSPKDVNKAQIEDIFDSIKISFNMIDPDGIMDCFHPDFLHHENNFDDERIIWETRINSYTEIDFSDIEIDFIGNNFANVSFQMTFFFDNDNIVWNEPSEENGDISYFYKDFDTWKVCGNNFSTE